MAKLNGSKQRLVLNPIRYVPCRVEPGMFRGEYLVHLNGYDPKEPGTPVSVQMFADENEVKAVEGKPQHNQPAQAWVCVSLARHHGPLAEVILPQPAQPVGESMLVASETLREKVGL